MLNSIKLKVIHINIMRLLNEKLIKNLNNTRIIQIYLKLNL